MSYLVIGVCVLSQVVWNKGHEKNDSPINKPLLCRRWGILGNKDSCTLVQQSHLYLQLQ